MTESLAGSTIKAMDRLLIMSLLAAYALANTSRCTCPPPDAQSLEIDREV